MEEALSKAVIEGNLDSLDHIMREDPLILHKILLGCFKANPLHLAISCNRVDSVKALLSHTGGELAEVLDSGRSALHLAAAGEDVEIVKELLRVRPEMCLARDSNRRNPIHIAAMKGKVGALEELVRACPKAAREKLDRDETVLHLCVKHEQLQLLLNMSIGAEFVNARDGSGNTILHLAVYGNHFEIVEVIVEYDNLEVNIEQKRKKIKVDIANAEGNTPLDIIYLSRDKRLESILRKAKCKRARGLDLPLNHPETQMVVASLVATMAFQAALSPPGGVWQENTTMHRAGEAVMAYNNPNLFKHFLCANKCLFLTSLITIVLLTSRLPFKNRIFMGLLVLSLLLMITSIAIIHELSINAVSPKKYLGPVGKEMVWIVLGGTIMGCLFMFQTYNLIRDLLLGYQSRSLSGKIISWLGFIDRSHESNNESTDELTPSCTAMRQGNINQPQDQVQIEMKQRD